MSERLTTEQLDYLDHLAKKTRAKHGTMTTVLVSDLETAIAELKSLRAAQVTSEEREALRFARACIYHYAGRPGVSATRSEIDASLAVLDRLLGTEVVEPVTEAEVRSALEAGGRERAAAERALKRSPRR
jgi:hypothetical protein